MANKLRVSKSGSGAPTAITPDFLGQIYIDETSGTRYEATALTKGSWVDKLSLKEDTANKKTDLSGNSDTYYPTQKAVKTAVDAKQDALTFGIANTNALKVDDASAADNDYAKFTANGIEGVPYSTVLSDIGAQAVLGYIAENAANKVTSFQATPTDTAYPTEKLVHTALGGKQDTMTKAGSSDIKDNSTEDAKYTTPKGLADSKLVWTDKKQDIENKRIFPRVISGVASSSEEITLVNYSIFRLRVHSDITLIAPDETLGEGEVFMIYLTSDEYSAGSNITWNDNYRSYAWISATGGLPDKTIDGTIILTCQASFMERPNGWQYTIFVFSAEVPNN